MNEVASRVLDYLSYKNKVRTAEWEERLWQQHLNGAPEDFRADEDRQRYFDLLSRLEKSRSLASKLHTRRTAHAPRFAEFSATGG
jgi:hypothetical protein